MKKWQYSRQYDTRSVFNLERGLAVTYRRGTRCLPLILDPLGTNGRDDPDHLVPLLLVRNMPGVVIRLQAPRMRHRPDLQEMHAFFRVVVEFAVSDSGSRRGHLQVASFEDLGVVQRVAVGELAVEDWMGSRVKVSA
jgi:hypothetical protein